MGNANDAGIDRIHLPDWRWVPRTVHLHILLAYLNADLLRHVGSPRPAGFTFLRRSYKGFRGRKRGELTVVVLVVPWVIAAVTPAIGGQLVGLAPLGVRLQHRARGDLDTIEAFAFVAMLLGPLLWVGGLADVDFLSSLEEGVGLALLLGIIILDKPIWDSYVKGLGGDPGEHSVPPILPRRRSRIRQSREHRLAKWSVLPTLW